MIAGSGSICILKSLPFHAYLGVHHVQCAAFETMAASKTVYQYVEYRFTLV